MGLTPSALAYLKQKVPQKTSVYWEGHSLLPSNTRATLCYLFVVVQAQREMFQWSEDDQLNMSVLCVALLLALSTDSFTQDG